MEFYEKEVAVINHLKNKGQSGSNGLQMYHLIYTLSMNWYLKFHFYHTVTYIYNHIQTRLSYLS